MPAFTCVSAIAPPLPLPAMLRATPVVVVTLRAVTLMADTPLPVMASEVPVLRSMPLTMTLLASVSVSLSVGVFAGAPGTVRTPPAVSVAPAPISCCPDSIV